MNHEGSEAQGGLAPEPGRRRGDLVKVEYFWVILQAVVLAILTGIMAWGDHDFWAMFFAMCFILTYYVPKE